MGIEQAITADCGFPQQMLLRCLCKGPWGIITLKAIKLYSIVKLNVIIKYILNGV